MAVEIKLEKGAPGYNVAFTGPQGCGKTTLAKAWVDAHPRWRMKLAFADALREEVAGFIATTQDTNGNWTTDKELRANILADMVGSPDQKRPYRKILQVWGTEVRRHINGDDYWLRQLKQKITAPWTASYIAIDDARFMNEYAMLKDLGFKLVLLMPNPEWDGWKQLQHHESERDWHSVEADLELPWTSVENRLKALRYAFEGDETP